MYNLRIVQLADVLRAYQCYTFDGVGGLPVVGRALRPDVGPLLGRINGTGEEKAIMYEQSDDESSKEFTYTILSLIFAIGAGLGVGIATNSVIVGVAVGIGGLIIAGLLLIATVDDQSAYPASEEANYIGVGIAIGAGLGVAFGVVLSTVVDNPAFLGVGISLGVGPSVAIGAALNARNKKNDQERLG